MKCRPFLWFERFDRVCVYMIIMSVTNVFISDPTEKTGINEETASEWTKKKIDTLLILTYLS